MRTNIEIDDAIMLEAMQSSGTKTKRGTVDAGLRSLIRMQNQIRSRHALLHNDRDFDTFERELGLVVVQT